MENTNPYSSSELLTINAARLIRDGDTIFVGVGLPNLACNLARRLHAPNILMIYEAGIIGAQPSRLPLSIGDPTLVSGAVSVCSMYDIFAFYLQRGNVDVGFLGGAQIDRFGNINATVIGDYDHPKVRLPGSGGSMEIAAWAKRCYILTPHTKRRLPEKVDFLTSAGFLTNRTERQGILEPDLNGELILCALHPGISVEKAKENTGWELKISSKLRFTDPPSELELHILRDELDPQGIYLRSGA
jgi:glutaconate CoA-transferase subunit B